MKPYVAVVVALCFVGAFAQKNNYYGSVREVLQLYKECSDAEGLSPCLKMKALSLIDRVSRMEKITLMDGIVITGKTEEKPNEVTLEEEEKNLPRALDAKSQALTNMMINRIARMIGSKSIEISIPKLVESARKHEDDGGNLSDLFGGGGGEGHGDKLHRKKGKDKKKDKGSDLKDFLMMMMAHKLAMLPLLVAGLFVLAVKALAQAKIALLITGIIYAKKMLANRDQGHQVEHVHASSGGWNGAGGGSGWNGGSGGGWNSGWDKRSFEETQNLAYKGQKQA